MEADNKSDDDEVMEIPDPQFPAGSHILVPIEDGEVQEVVNVNGHFLTQQELAVEIQERQDTPILMIENCWVELEDGRYMVFFCPGIRPPTPVLGEQLVRAVEVDEVANYQEEVEHQRVEIYQEANAHADRLVLSGLRLLEY